MIEAEELQAIRGRAQALAAHEPEFHRWMAADHPLKCQTSTASPAEPGELPWY
jgi:hypothetical protein